MTVRQRRAAVNASAIRLKNEGHQWFRQIYTRSLFHPLAHVMVKW